MTYSDMEECEHFKGSVVHCVSCTAWHVVQEIQLLKRPGLSFMLAENNLNIPHGNATEIFMIIGKGITLSITIISLHILCLIPTSFLWWSFGYNTEQTSLSLSSSTIIFTSNLTQ